MKKSENIFQKIGNILGDKDLINAKNIKKDSNFILEDSFVKNETENKKELLNMFLEISRKNEIPTNL